MSNSPKSAPDNENRLEFKVQYADTDAYGVVWHGTYLRWMEAGRVEWLLDHGVRIDELARDFGIVMPVVEVNVKYKFPAKLMNEVVLTTSIKECSNASVIFSQIITLKETGKICTIAEIRATAIDKNGKVVRNIKDLIGLKSPETDNFKEETLC